MLLRVHDVEVTTRHVEIPDHCEGCGAPVGPAIELNLRDGATYGVLEADPEEPPEEALLDFAPDLREPCPDEGTYVVVGYRCRACGHVLAKGAYVEND